MIINLFLQLSQLLGLTTFIAFLTRILRQPLLIAYIIAGICAGPLFLNLIHKEQDIYELFSQLGVVLLLFVVGLSLNFNYLKKIGKVAIVTGVGQVVFTGIIGIIILKIIGFSLLTSIYLAIAITFSSTIIITKLLADKKDTESLYGRYTIGLMLVQDVIAIIIMIAITASNQSGSIFNSLGLLILKGIGLIAIVLFFSKIILPFLLHRVAHSSEFLFLFTLAWCFGMTSLAYLVGFSLEIGALMAGLSLGSSPYQTEISSRIKPLRDFFLILFFIILGSEMTISNFQTALLPGIILAFFILIGNPFILYALFRCMKFTRRNSFLAGLTAAQVSEFGFVLLFVGQQKGAVTQNELAIFTIVALLTIFISSYLITYNEQIYKLFSPWFQLFKPDKHKQIEEKTPEYDIWVIGYHRIGWRICEALKEKKASFAVVDFNPDTAASLRKQEIPAYFGDVADIEFLSELPLEKAKLIISTIPNVEDQLVLIRHVRSLSPKVYIMANLPLYNYREILYAAGANYVMMPHLLGGGWIAELIKKQHFSKKIFAKLRKEQQEEVKLGMEWK